MRNGRVFNVIFGPTMFAILCLLVHGALASTQCGPNVFARKLAVLKQTTPPFNANALYPEYRRPQSDPQVGIADAVRQYLDDVFAIAPRFFQERLCAETTIFVDLADCRLACSHSPWAFREHPGQFAPNAPPVVYARYVAIPGSVPPTYSTYETMVLRTLLAGWSGPKVYTDRNDVALTGLAILAHEDGHILFRERLARFPGAPIDVMQFCEGSFFTGSWKPPIDSAPMDFAGVSGRHLDSDVQIPDLLTAVRPPRDEDRASELLKRLYNGNRWASLLAAFSAEHDFVETYKLYVLLKAKVALRSLRVEIPIGDTVVDNDVASAALNGSSELARKLRCFEALFPTGR